MYIITGHCYVQGLPGCRHGDDDSYDDDDDCLSFDYQVVGERTFIRQAPNWSESVQTVGPEPGAGAWYLLLIIFIIVIFIIILLIIFIIVIKILIYCDPLLNRQGRPDKTYRERIWANNQPGLWSASYHTFSPNQSFSKFMSYDI